MFICTLCVLLIVRREKKDTVQELDIEFVVSYRRKLK
jgi:hypothetical protein